MNTSDVPRTIEYERGSHDYPTRDGRPFDSDVHREVMFEAIEMLQRHFAAQMAYVTGNLLTFYRRGDRSRFVSPDVMVVKGIEPGPRLNYLVWEEGRSPNAVIEITSARTRREDLKYKFEIYRSEMRIPEYFIFDPAGEYLTPRLCGFRLVGERYVPIDAVAGNIPSTELGIYLAAVNTRLRFLDLHNGQWIPTLSELCSQAYLARVAGAVALEKAEAASNRADQECERLVRELDDLRKRMSGGSA